MKKTKSILFGAILAVASGCSVYVGPGGASVVVAPAVEVVPAAYVWDGYEYVGEVGGRFYYYGPAGAWVVCDGVVWGRFDRWQVGHRDWRERAIRNDGAYRLDREHHTTRAIESRSAPRRESAPARPATATQRKAVEEKKPAQPGHPGTAPRTGSAPKKPGQEDDKNDRR